MSGHRFGAYLQIPKSVFTDICSSVPPNLLFELDDLEKDWTWNKRFDFVFSRAMAGSFNDYQAYIQKAYE